MKVERLSKYVALVSSRWGKEKKTKTKKKRGKHIIGLEDEHWENRLIFSMKMTDARRNKARGA
jgi:hypothetical protein